MTEKYTFKTIYKQVQSQKSDFWRSNIFGILSTLFLLPIPLLIPLLIDEVLLKNPGKMTSFISNVFNSSEVWVYIVSVMIVVLFLRMWAFYFSNKKTFYSIKITQNVAYSLRHNILHHLQRVSISEYETIKSGGVTSKTIKDVEILSAFAGQAVTTLLTSTLMLVGIALIMFWINWILAIFVFVFNPIFFAFSKILGQKISALLRRQNEAYELYNEMITETLELFIQVRASNQEYNFFDILRARAKDIERATFEFGYKAYVVKSKSNLLTSTVIDIFRVLGIAAVAYSDLSIGMMIAFLFYLSTLIQPVNHLSALIIGYQSVKPAMERVNSIFALKKEPKYIQKYDPFTGVNTTSVELKNVSFSYANGKEILSDITLKAKAGQKIALIGTSGSGKTTIAQIMVGFYATSKGVVSYNNVPIKDIGLPLVRDNVALMLQESLFFNDTIRNNLTLSKDIEDHRIYEVLEAVQMGEFINSLKNTLDTHIGKNGIRLSGGQRQRLAMARLALSDPKVVILDEATSALDTTTEFKLYQSIVPFVVDKTIIIIAHRTSTIKKADYIYLIDEGRIKAEGTFEELESLGFIKDDFDA